MVPAERVWYAHASRKTAKHRGCHQVELRGAAEFQPCLRVRLPENWGRLHGAGLVALQGAAFDLILRGKQSFFRFSTGTVLASAFRIPKALAAACSAAGGSIAVADIDATVRAAGIICVVRNGRKGTLLFHVTSHIARGTAAPEEGIAAFMNVNSREQYQ